MYDFRLRIALAEGADAASIFYAFAKLALAFRELAAFRADSLHKSAVAQVWLRHFAYIRRGRSPPELTKTYGLWSRLALPYFCVAIRVWQWSNLCFIRE